MTVAAVRAVAPVPLQAAAGRLPRGGVQGERGPRTVPSKCESPHRVALAGLPPAPGRKSESPGGRPTRRDDRSTRPDERPPSPRSACPPTWSRPSPTPASTEPFPIQALTIPDGLAGRDVCGKAKTGSGKTLAFGLPMVERTDQGRPAPPPALGARARPASSPSRCAPCSTPLAERRDLRVRAVYGGADIERQIKALQRGRRHRGGHPRPAHRPARPRRGRRSADVDFVVHRRGRPHGRHGLPAPGRVGAAPARPTPRADHAVLRHPRRRRRPPHPGATCPTRCATRSTRPGRRSRRWSTASSPCTRWTR